MLLDPQTLMLCQLNMNTDLAKQENTELQEGLTWVVEGTTALQRAETGVHIMSGLAQGLRLEGV